MTTELEDMRQQLSLLKEKLNRQEILNDQLVRQALEGKIRYIDSFSRRKRIWLITCMLFVPGILISAVGIPVWFALATAAFFAVYYGLKYYGLHYIGHLSDHGWNNNLWTAFMVFLTLRGLLQAIRVRKDIYSQAK